MEWKRFKKALGTDIEISVITDDPNVERRIESVFDFFLSFEQEFSRFLPLSSLSILNREKSLKVSNRFLNLFEHCKSLYKKTNGYFNPLVDIATIGYSHSFEENNFAINAREVNLKLESVQVVDDTIILWETQNLDFGGIGKWYAVMLASSFLRNFGYDDFFINAWGDIYTSGKNNDGKKWIIGIENPFDESLMASVSITNKSIATSGNYKRKWKIWAEERHHIFNPILLKNNFETASVTIISDNCTETDAYTKAVFNMEPREAIRFIEKNKLSGMIVLADGKTLYSKDFVDNFEVKFY